MIVQAICLLSCIVWQIPKYVIENGRQWEESDLEFIRRFFLI